MRRSRNQKQQTGFTLIELVIVIVIIGILAAVAIPKFTSLSDDANQAATSGIAGALASASSTNYALRSGLGTTKGVAIGDCQAVSNAMDGGLPSTDYTIATVTITNGATASCTLSGPGTASATFVGHGVT